MKQIALQFLFILLMFFGCWTLLRQIDWIELLNIKQVSQRSEKKLGELYWDFFKKSKEDMTSDRVLLPVDSLLQAICDANEMDRDKIKLHILKDHTVNAFALPDGHLVIYSGLIADCESEAELSGVLGHELAHIQERHVMQKLIREVGLSVILSTATGSSGETIRNTAKLFSTSAYDRALEREADRKSMDYLSNANLPMEPTADFFDRLAENENAASRYLEWINTHPDTRKRAELIRTYSQGKSSSKRVILNGATWKTLQLQVHTN